MTCRRIRCSGDLKYNSRSVTYRYISADRTPTPRGHDDFIGAVGEARLDGPVKRPRPRHQVGFVVTIAAETLLEQALTLPLEDRALLASGLLASLDSESIEDAEVDRLWSAETERRATLLDSGEARLVTWENLVSRIDERRA